MGLKSMGSMYHEIEGLLRSYFQSQITLIFAKIHYWSKGILITLKFSHKFRKNIRSTLWCSYGALKSSYQIQMELIDKKFQLWSVGTLFSLKLTQDYSKHKLNELQFSHRALKSFS